MVALSKSNWKRDLRYILRKGSKTVVYHSGNVYNYRINSMGGETEFTGYRAGILYFQLSKQIDLKIVGEGLRIISQFLGPRGRQRYATLFLNNENYKLMHPRGMVTSYQAVMKIVNDFFHQYGESNEEYGTCLAQLFPMVDLYERERFPSHQDICVAFCDQRKIEIQDEIREKGSKKRLKWIWFKIGSEDVSIELENWS